MLIKCFVLLNTIFNYEPNKLSSDYASCNDVSVAYILLPYANQKGFHWHLCLGDSLQEILQKSVDKVNSRAVDESYGLTLNYLKSLCFEPYNIALLINVN